MATPAQVRQPKQEDAAVAVKLAEVLVTAVKPLLGLAAGLKLIPNTLAAGMKGLNLSEFSGGMHKTAVPVVDGVPANAARALVGCEIRATPRAGVMTRTVGWKKAA